MWFRWTLPIACFCWRTITWQLCSWSWASRHRFKSKSPTELGLDLSYWPKSTTDWVQDGRVSSLTFSTTNPCIVWQFSSNVCSHTVVSSSLRNGTMRQRPTPIRVPKFKPICWLRALSCLISTSRTDLLDICDFEPKI